MAMPNVRDIERTRAEVGAWLAARLGVGRVDIGAVSFPKAGFSNETIFLTAQWQDAGQAHTEDLVLRIEPTSHQLFVKPDALFQAAMMTALGEHEGTPVPRIWFTEPDASILGAPFFLMERTYGRIPADVPSYHVKGWVTELAPSQVSRLYDSGIAVLAALHRIDWRDGFEFLDQGRACRAWPIWRSSTSGIPGRRPAGYSTRTSWTRRTATLSATRRTPPPRSSCGVMPGSAT